MSAVPGKAGVLGEDAVKTTQDKTNTARRAFLRKVLTVAATSGAALGTPKLLATEQQPAQRPAGPPAIPDYDWSKHDWGYGIDANRCIGCLRCVEACKIENGVSKDPHHFRTWVERYVDLEGEDHPRVDTQAYLGNIAAAQVDGK